MGCKDEWTLKLTKRFGWSVKIKSVQEELCICILKMKRTYPPLICLPISILIKSLFQHKTKLHLYVLSAVCRCFLESTWTNKPLSSVQTLVEYLNEVNLTIILFGIKQWPLSIFRSTSPIPAFSYYLPCY